MQTFPSEHAAPFATHLLATQQPPPAQVLPAQQAWLESPQPSSGVSGSDFICRARASTAASGAIEPPVPPEPPAPPAPPVEMGPSAGIPRFQSGRCLPPTPPVVMGVSLPSAAVSGASTAASGTIEPPVSQEPPMPPAPPVEMGPSVGSAPPVPVGPSFHQHHLFRGRLAAAHGGGNVGVANALSSAEVGSAVAPSWEPVAVCWRRRYTPRSARRSDRGQRISRRADEAGERLQG